VYDGLMLDNNSIELLYTESKGGAAVVASIVQTRQKQ
jgi:hypothetical protein